MENRFASCAAVTAAVVGTAPLVHRHGVLRLLGPVVAGPDRRQGEVIRPGRTQHPETRPASGRTAVHGNDDLIVDARAHNRTDRPFDQA